MKKTIFTSGKINVTGLMDQIALSALPATIQPEFPLIVGILWKGVATLQEVTLRLRAPSGDVKDFMAPALSSQHDTQFQAIDLSAEISRGASSTRDTKRAPR
ncbi:MAG: hypothetical protein HKL91_00885 [Candidatus Eremiobacteraeota bacterium]|uniref:Uncharacterized protein n=1 Tax=mine drainage metagenome TaxID=410659 RepID=E6PFM0_9ZZZZ|nr:hypothetical protein [Candidatus Eremiobacteraeota bacterium]